MVNLNNFLDKMTSILNLSKTDILDNEKQIIIFNEANEQIDNLIKTNKDFEKNITDIFNSLLDTDDEINNMLKTFKSSNPDNIKEFKKALAKIQLKTLVVKYNKYLIDNKLIDAVNNKLEAVIKIMKPTAINNKYYIYYKYIKYKNKYLQLKYNYI